MLNKIREEFELSSIDDNNTASKLMNAEIKDYDELEQAYKELKDCKEWWRNRFNAVQRDYEELKQENERLKMRNDMLRKDNNWNELKKFVENELNHNVDKEKSFMGYQCKIILDKIKDLENDN